MKAIREFSERFLKQNPNGKFVIGCAGLVLLACLWGGVMSILARSSQSPKLPPTLTFQPGLSPTALFNFGVETFTPFPTLPPATSLPTLTPLPTATPVLTSTAVIIILATKTSITNTSLTSSDALNIVNVDKAQEYVDIQNSSTTAIDLTGWVLLSEKGHQPCDLKGVLQPGEALRVWSRTGDSGLSCGYPGNIWNDKEADDAVLYNPQGKEISRFP